MQGQIDLFGNVEVDYVSETDLFRRECEEFIVDDGTGFINGKRRIIDWYNEDALDENVLKKEYGIGGHSVTWRDGKRGFTNHDAKGIECLKCQEGGRDMKVEFTWKEVLKLIKNAIYEGRYAENVIKWKGSV